MSLLHQGRRTDNQIPLQSVESHWQTVFNKYDRDNDGRIALLEFHDVLTSRHINHEIPEYIVHQILQRADLDKDGYITFNEFMQMVESKEGNVLMMSMLQKYVQCTVVPCHRRILAADGIDGDYEEEYSCNPPAICMLIVSILEIGVFAWDVAVSGSSSIDGPLAQLFIYNPHRRYEAWRFLTYMFTHVGLLHLLVNLMVQIMLGIPLEMVHRWWRVLIVYLAGVVAGSLGTSVSDPNVYLAGASGGVYAIMAAHIATIIMNWSEMQFAPWQLLIFIILTVVDVGSAVYNRYIANIDQQIGYVAHLAGAGAGLLVGLYVLRNLEVRSWERLLWWSAVVLFLVLMAIGIIWNIALPQYFPPQY